MIKIFISHASEDKAEFVRPLVSEISKLYDVWYDEFNLNLGDSLLQSIQKGLIESDYGLVVLSPNFFKKHWTQAELDGLFSLEIATGKKIIPIWHQLTFEDVAKESPILAGRLAANSSAGISTIARQIESVVSSDR
ncbi:toll/interleukin-1 receptor domain-containing protein, partial [Pseudoalteromonas holothuriae]|uniref:toll/interleukin-1 receptor domain-containing protein n=1 Tax=Pseudoalteromonas holothuriae TaxID=2963714 RepID=UPI0021C056FD